MDFQTIAASASPEVPMNENFDTINHTSVYGKRHPVTTGLTWGYYGGRWSGNSIAAGTLTLSNNSTNYIVVNRSTGAISTSTATTNWNDTSNYARVYKVVTSGGLVVEASTEDHRAGQYGVHGFPASSSGTIGKHSIPIMASAMRPTTTNGCAALAAVEISAGQPEVLSLDFDPSTQEYAWFALPMPKSWNESTVTFKAIWSHPATTTNFGVVWTLAAVAISNDDALGTSYGTSQESADTGGTTNDLYVGPESSAITVAGTPADEDIVYFKVSRDVGAGADTMAVDARLHGIILYITTNAETDA